MRLPILSQWRDIVRDFSGRQARYGSLAFASIAVVLGILAAINFLGQRAVLVPAAKEALNLSMFNGRFGHLDATPLIHQSLLLQEVLIDRRHAHLLIPQIELALIGPAIRDAVAEGGGHPTALLRS